MKLACPALVGTVTFLLYATTLSAEEGPPAMAATSRPKPETRSAPATVSTTLSAAILAGLPRYSPPPTEQIKSPSSAEDETQAEPESTPLGPDQPTNKIIRLPRYTVEGSRPPVFRESELYSKKAFGRILAKRYFSEIGLALNSVSIFGSAEAYALAMYEQEERLRNIAELKNDAAMARLVGDKADSEFILRETNRTFLRSGGMDWNTWRK